MKTFGLIDKAFFLKSVRIFSALDLELLLAVAEKLQPDEYDADEQVFTANHSANRIYIIAEGSVLLLNEQMQPFCELGAGEFFGDESVFSEQPRAYAATCKSDTILLTLSRSHLLSIISECPSVAISLLHSYAHKIPCRHRS